MSQCIFEHLVIRSITILLVAKILKGKKHHALVHIVCLYCESNVLHLNYLHMHSFQPNYLIQIPLLIYVKRLLS